MHDKEPYLLLDGVQKCPKLLQRKKAWIKMAEPLTAVVKNAVQIDLSQDACAEHGASDVSSSIVQGCNWSSMMTQ